MGAIFGFTGSPDSKLASSMDRALSHRGTKRLLLAGESRYTFGYRGRDDKDGQTGGAGIHREGDGVIALAGSLRNDDLPRPALPAMLRAYREEGLAFLQCLRGDFVLALADRKKLHLARDGAGVRTLFYGRHEDRVLFAVEPKGVLAAPGFPRRVRPEALAQYLAFSFVPGSGTMLQGLYELPAGCRVSFDLAEPRVSEPERYVAFEAEEPPVDPSDPPETWVRRTRALVAQAVADRLPGRHPTAVFLSGGLDSSIVTWEVARQHDGPVKTYSIHFGEQYPHELDFARQVAERCGTEHEEVLIRPKGFLPRLRRIIWHLDDPIGDPITVPNFELSARVASEHRYVFNGEGGDPLFGGPKNLPMMLHHWYGHPRERGFREKRYLASYRRGYEILSHVLSPEWVARIDPERDLEAVLTPFFETDRPRSLLNKLMAINIRLKAAHLILPKVDRMTAAAGLHALAPLFDERLIRLSFAMPPRLKLGGGVEKLVLKRAYADHLPADVIERPKSGMRVPVHFWFQKELKRYARSILSRRALRRAGIFHPDEVQKLLRYRSERGPGRYGLRLWMILTFEIWRRIVVEREPV